MAAMEGMKAAICILVAFIDTNGYTDMPIGVGRQIGRFAYADHISSYARHKGTHCRHIELGRGTEARATLDHITSWPERQRP